MFHCLDLRDEVQWREIRDTRCTMESLRVKPEIISLLKSGNFEAFSVPRLRDAYQELVGDTSKPKKVVSQLVKRHLRKLEDHGVLERVDTGKPYPIEYRIKHTASLQSGSVFPEVEEIKPQSDAEVLSEEVVQVIRGKLNDYRTYMYSAMGALEEYEEIVELQPSLKVTIQSKYDQTREEYAKTLGKVRALESLINLQHPL